MHLIHFGHENIIRMLGEEIVKKAMGELHRVAERGLLFLHALIIDFVG
jgi:hypothetical protein